MILGTDCIIELSDINISSNKLYTTLNKEKTSGIYEFIF